jgi:hypothetical protein
MDKLYRGELRTVLTLNKGISWGKEGGSKEAQVLRDGLGAHLKEQDQVSSSTTSTIAEPQLLKDKIKTSAGSGTRAGLQVVHEQDQDFSC